MYLYLKTLHIIFIVTWFAGMFYMPRLFIYNTEANEKSAAEKEILQKQFSIMIKRLWYGITWPSAVLTLILGPLVWYQMSGALPNWLMVKLCFVIGLYVYHFTLHIIFKQQINGVFKYSSQQLRMWNEVATIFLVAIVALAVMKDATNFLWLLVWLMLFIMVILIAIKIYKKMRR